MFRYALLPLALLALSGVASAALIDSGTVNLVVPNTNIGLFVNVVNGTTHSGPTLYPVAGGGGFNYDFGIFDGRTAADPFLFDTPGSSGQSSSVPSTSSGYVSTTAGDIVALAPGTVIDGSSTFYRGYPRGAAVSTGAPLYVGFRFRDEGADLASTADDTVHYGFAQVILTQGRPGTLVRYAYESTPLTPITVGASAVPEPATLAALGLGAAAMIRRRRKSA